MKTIYKAILLLPLLCSGLGGSVTLFSQEECRQLLTGYIADMEKISAPEKGKVYYLHVTLQNKFRQATDAVKNIEMKTYITANRLMLQSTLMQMYADTADLFMVLPAARHIVRSRGISAIKARERQLEMLNMQRQLIEGCTVMECVSEGNIRKMRLRPSSDIAAQYALEEMLLCYDTAKRQVRSVHLFYTGKSKIAEQLVEYKAIDFNSSFRFKQPSAAASVLTKQGNLRDEFAGYVLIDE
jgi:hypothetical protein